MVFIQDEGLKTLLINITFPVWNLIAGFSLLFAAKRSAVVSRRLSLAWLTLAFAQFSYAFGDVTWSILETGLGRDPFPSLADGFYLIYYPLFLLGILLLPVKRLSRSDWFKAIIDMCIVMLAAVLVFWIYLLGPLAASGLNEPIWVQLLTLAYPVGDLVLLAAILILIFRKAEGQSPAPLILISAGAAIFILSDCLYGYQTLLGSYRTGGPADLGWTIGYLFFTLAGVLQVYAARPIERQLAAVSTFPGTYGVNHWITYFPYGWVVAAYVLLVQSHFDDLPLTFAWIACIVFAIISLVLVRQTLVLKENNLLFKELKEAISSIRHQTLALRDSNQSLEIEISERKRAEEQLAHDALHDSLTGLPNRALFLDRLDHAIQVGKRRANFSFAVLFLDIDQFKVVNDSLGHTAGDQLLIAVAGRLRNCMRGSDMVARLGGDEFVILLEDSGELQNVIETAERIQRELHPPFDLGEQKTFVSASIGILSSLTDYFHTEDILRDADLAMYQAKSLGKARYEVFTTELRDLALNRLELEQDLRTAMEHWELFLDYQPIVSLNSQYIIGFEALLRWRHPTRGLVSPTEFIPIAEETGMIIPIGLWILEEACRQIHTWQEKYPCIPPLTMNVNISNVQLSQPDFVEKLERILSDSDLDGGSLKLEINERTCLSSSKTISDALRNIGKLGVMFQIDDFGTGYSSLAYLRDYPVQGIKIDRSFISKMRGNGNSEVVRTLIALAQDMGLQAIAEGVETEEQLLRLKSLGCNYGQGYLISYPVGRTGIEELLKNKTVLPKDNVPARPKKRNKALDSVTD